MLSIRYSDPFFGTLAASGTVAGWLLENQRAVRVWKLISEKGNTITELELFSFIQANEPRWEALMKHAGLDGQALAACRLLGAASHSVAAAPIAVVQPQLELIGVRS